MQYFRKLFQDAAWQATPERRKTSPDNYNISLHIKKLIQEKRSPMVSSEEQETHSLKQPSTELHTD